MINKQEMIDFETEIANEFLAAKIRSPVHLSGGNEDQLIDLFKTLDIKEDDWVLTTWRNHYHALLHGMSIDKLRAEIMNGCSMSLCSESPKILTSSIVGGICPIAVGLGLALKLQKSTKRVFCFIGDMAAHAGIFYESHNYVASQNLPVTFIIEDNSFSVSAPTDVVWGKELNFNSPYIYHYKYERTYPHVGTGKWVDF